MKRISLKRWWRSWGKRPFYAIPFLFTFANAICGFLSVLKTLDEEFVLAAVFIVCAAVMDFCDGRAARILGVTSYMGMELDSLCDAISFGFAPAVLVYSWSLYQLPIVGMIALILFLCCGLFRLARFNTSVKHDHPYFIGLPITVAAFFIASFVVAQDWLAQSLFHSVLRPERVAFIVSILALLMISSIKFPSVKYLKMRLEVVGIIGILSLLVAWALFQRYPVFLFLVSAYIVSGFFFGIIREVLRPLR